MKIDALFKIGFLLGFLALAATGFYLRMTAMGNRSFFIDELYHVYSANSLNTDGTYSLPSGKPYKRAALHTYMVSLCFSFLGVSEFSARLPSALWGLVYLGFFYFFVVKLFDHKIAYVSTFLLLFSSLEIYYSSECRMYSLFQLLYLIEAIIFYCIFDALSSKPGPFSLDLLKKNAKLCIVGLMVLIVLSYISLKLQVLSLLFFPSIAVFLLIFLAHKMFAKFNINQLYLFFTVLGFYAVLVLIGYYFRDRIHLFFMNLGYVPLWGRNQEINIFLYIKRLMEWESFYLWLFIPIGFLFNLYKRPMPTSYMCLLFIVPFTILSFHPLKNIRYIYHFYPFVLVFVAMGLVLFFEPILKMLRPGTPFWQRVSAGIVFPVVLFFLTFKYAQSFTETQLRQNPTPDWRKAASLMKQLIPSEDIVVADNSIGVNYYYGRVNYVMDENILDISKNSENKRPDGRWLDNYTHAVHITSIQELDTLLHAGKPVWVILGHPNSGYPQIKHHIRAQGLRITDPNLDERIEIYRFN